MPADAEERMAALAQETRDEWLVARRAHLKNEKALTRMRDLVAAERRALPWVKVDKEYLFDTPEGKKTLADLFLHQAKEQRVKLLGIVMRRVMAQFAEPMQDVLLHLALAAELRLDGGRFEVRHVVEPLPAWCHPLCGGNGWAEVAKQPSFDVRASTA